LKKLTLYTAAIYAAIFLLLIFLYFVYSGNLAKAGPFAIGFFLTLALAFRGYESLKGYVFTILIFAAVTTSLYFPQYFIQWGGFTLKGLIIPLLQIIMFGMGTSPFPDHNVYHNTYRPFCYTCINEITCRFDDRN